MSVNVSTIQAGANAVNGNVVLQSQNNSMSIGSIAPSTILFNVNPVTFGPVLIGGNSILGQNAFKSGSSSITITYDGIDNINWDISSNLTLSSITSVTTSISSLSVSTINGVDPGNYTIPSNLVVSSITAPIASVSTINGWTPAANATRFVGNNIFTNFPASNSDPVPMQSFLNPLQNAQGSNIDQAGNININSIDIGNAEWQTADGNIYLFVSDETQTLTNPQTTLIVPKNTNPNNFQNLQIPQFVQGGAGTDAQSTLVLYCQPDGNQATGSAGNQQFGMIVNINTSQDF